MRLWPRIFRVFCRKKLAIPSRFCIYRCFPIEKDPARQVALKRERIEYWLSRGAIPSDTVSQILLRSGIKNKYAEQKTTRRTRAKIAARKKGVTFTKAEKLAAQKAAEEAASSTEAKST